MKNPSLKEIQELRHSIDKIDDQVLKLINQRLLAVRKIGQIKNHSGVEVVDTYRESQIYRRLSSLNNGPLKESALHQIFRSMIATGREIQNAQKEASVEPLYVLFGNPIGHSLSPVMHNSALAHLGLDGCYFAFQVENIAAAVDGIRGLGISGASVTIPHKISVLPYLDSVDPVAAKIGAVNTLVNKNGILRGYNSDVVGAIKALTEVTVIKDKEVAVIGAGGGARAIGFGLQQEGGIVTVINRSISRGELLAKDLGCNFKSLAEIKSLPYQIVVNATPVGMIPDIGSMPISSEFLDPEMVVMDIVYNPLKTQLLKAAQRIGCKIVDGVSMFVHQGAVQFELWTEKKAPVDIMRKVVLEELNSN